MRILLIHNFYQWGGGEDRYVLSLQKLLLQNGHAVHLYAKDSKDIASTLDKVKTAIGLVSPQKVRGELSNVIEDFQPDVVQIQNVFPLISFVAYEVCKAYSLPIVQRISNYRFLCPKGTLFRDSKICELCVNKSYPYPAILYSCYHNSRTASFLLGNSLWSGIRGPGFKSIGTYIFPSVFIKKYFEKSLRLPSEKLIVLPTFSEDKIYKKSQEKENYFVYVGRLSEEKGILYLLELFKQNPHLKLVVVGDGPLKTVVQKYISNKNILFVGRQSKQQVADYLRKALLTIIPSQCYDVLPQTLIESFREGTPVVAPNIGSFPSLIKRNKTGFIYEADNPHSLKKILESSLKNSNKIHCMSSQIRGEYQKSYSPVKHYKSLIKIYIKIIKENEKR